MVAVVRFLLQLKPHGVLLEALELLMALVEGLVPALGLHLAQVCLSSTERQAQVGRVPVAAASAGTEVEEAVSAQAARVATALSEVTLLATVLAAAARVLVLHALVVLERQELSTF